MSGTLVWEPVNRRKVALPVGLKWVLEKKFGGSFNVEMNMTSIPYLQGLRDGNVSGAEELIATIEKHESVSLSVEY